MQHKQCIVVQNIKFSFEAACELFPFFYITQNVSVQAQVLLVSTKCYFLIPFFKMSVNLMAQPLKCSVHSSWIPSLSPRYVLIYTVLQRCIVIFHCMNRRTLNTVFFLISGHLVSTPHNSNSQQLEPFSISLEGSSY